MVAAAAAPHDAVDDGDLAEIKLGLKLRTTRCPGGWGSPRCCLGSR